MITFGLIALMQAATMPVAKAEAPLCSEIQTDIEPDMIWLEDDFTEEDMAEVVEILRTTLPEWIEGKAKRMQDFPGASDKVFDGEIWMAWTNHLNYLEGYTLKQAALKATPDRKEEAVSAFCTFLETTIIID